MTPTHPNLTLRDVAGLVLALLVAAVLAVGAFVTHAGPLLFIGLLLLLTFALLRHFRERGREAEAREVEKALRSRMHKGERLLAYTIGDRRRFKPLAVLTDFALLMFSQGLAAEGAGAVATDDTFVGLTNRRLIAITRQRRSPGQRRDWRERLYLRRRDTSRGKHHLLFEAPRHELTASVRLAVLYLARLRLQAADGQCLSIGLNSRYWAEQAIALAALVNRPPAGQ